MNIPTSFETIKKACLVAGVAALGVSAWMAWKFGSSISAAHGAALVIACFLAAIVFPARRFVVEAGANGRWLMAAGVFCVALEFLSHLGYTFGMRDKQFVEAGAQQVAWQVVHKNLDSERDNIAMLRTQLADLKARNKQHADKNSGWLTTVDPQVMRDQMATLDQLIESEAKRVRCAQKCETLKKQKIELAAAIANIKEENDLTSRIEATQRAIDAKVASATTTKVGHSTAKAQNAAFGEALRLAFYGSSIEEALQPDDKAKATTDTLADRLIGIMMAVGATIAPTLLFYFGFFSPSGPRLADKIKPTASAPITQDGYSKPALSLAPTHRETLIVHNNDKLNEILARWAGSNEARAIAA